MRRARPSARRQPPSLSRYRQTGRPLRRTRCEVAYQEIPQNGDAGGAREARRHQNIERPRRRVPANEHGNQAAGAQRLPGEEIGLQRDPDAGQQGTFERLRVGGAERPPDRDRLFDTLRVREMPPLAGGEVAVAETGMAFEVARPLRRAVPRKIGGRADAIIAIGSDRPRSESSHPPASVRSLW